MTIYAFNKVVKLESGETLPLLNTEYGAYYLDTNNDLYVVDKNGEIGKMRVTLEPFINVRFTRTAADSILYDLGTSSSAEWTIGTTGLTLEAPPIEFAHIGPVVSFGNKAIKHDPNVTPISDFINYPNGITFNFWADFSSCTGSLEVLFDDHPGINTTAGMVRIEYVSPDLLHIKTNYDGSVKISTFTGLLEAGVHMYTIFIDAGNVGDLVDANAYRDDGAVSGKITSDNQAWICRNTICTGRSIGGTFSHGSMFTGKLADFRVYNKILSEKEFNQIYSRGYIQK